MSISLLDQMEEEGVKEPLIAVMRHWLRLGTTKVCECSQKHIANASSAPHGQNCTIWNMVRALGLTQEVVERHHAEARTIEWDYRHQIERIASGYRTPWGAERIDYSMGRDAKNPRSLQALLEKARATDELRAAFAERTGKPATPENMNAMMREVLQPRTESLFGIDRSTYDIWRGNAVQPRRTLTPEVVEDALRTAAMQPDPIIIGTPPHHLDVRAHPLMPDGMAMLHQRAVRDATLNVLDRMAEADGRRLELQLYGHLSLEAASAPPLRVEYAGEFQTDETAPLNTNMATEENDDGET